MRNYSMCIVLLACVSLLIPSFALGYQPQGSPEDLYRLENLPLLRPGVTCKMFSSYDRTGGNNDGFQGTYSKLRVENGDSVIAEMEGAGCIQRIWFTHSVINQHGLLDRKAEHLRIYLDGSPIPAVDVPLKDLFSGQLEPFPKPLVGSGIGGFYCYVPIAYQKGCKVVVEGTAVRFYQLTYSELPKATGVETFSMKMSPERKRTLAKAVKVWSSLGDFSAFEVADTQSHSSEIALSTGEKLSIPLPGGGHMIRAVFLEVEPPDRDKALGGQIAFTWDQAAAPAVQVPLEYFFGQAFSPQPYRSLLLGASEGQFYNFVSMPYLQSASVEMTAQDPFKGVMTIITQPAQLAAGDFGYFHANYHEQLPTEDGRYYPLLNTSGAGHYLGVLLATEGKSGAPTWLEGDEVFTVDGQMAIHGTGTEDYFNCGWYAVNGRLNQPGALPAHGFPVYGKTEDFMRAVAYRWHVADPVPYAKSIEAKIEHGPQNDISANYRSLTLFYDTNPAQVKSGELVLKGDECIQYLQKRIWQMASGDPRQGLTIVDELAQMAEREENAFLLKGLRIYLEGVLTPGSESKDRLNLCLEETEGLIQSSLGTPKEKLEKDELEAREGQAPKSLLLVRDILQRASLDLARRVAGARGFAPGDELLIEARDTEGHLAPSPFYEETEDFMDSVAKVDDLHLVGKGARFTRGSTESTWARFTPDIPKPGYYEILVIFSYGANASDTRYEVKHAEGKTLRPLEQRGRPETADRNNRVWHRLGVFQFEKGLDAERGSVTLKAGAGDAPANEQNEYRAYADAVRFVFRGAKRPKGK